MVKSNDHQSTNADTDVTDKKILSALEKVGVSQIKFKSVEYEDEEEVRYNVKTEYGEPLLVVMRKSDNEIENIGCHAYAEGGKTPKMR